MGKFNVISLFIFLIGCGLQSSNKPSNKGLEQVNSIPSELLAQDLEMLQFWIHEAHGDPYRFTTKKKIDELFDQHIREIRNSGSMTEYEFLGHIFPIMAELRDGHSQAFPSDLDNIDGKVFLPFRIRFVDREPFVLKNYSDKPLSSGMRISKIDGEDADMFFNRLIPLVHRDGNIESIRYRRLENPMYLARMMKALGLSKEKHKIEVNDAGITKEYIVYPFDQMTYDRVSTVRESSTDKTIKLTFKKYGGSEIPIVTIRSFNPHYFNGSYESFTGQIDEVMGRIDQSKADKIILDLRNNSGGEDSYALYLLRYLMDKKFKYHGEVTFQKDDYKFLPDGKHWDIDPKCFRPNQKGTFDATDHLWPDGTSALGSFVPFENRFQKELVVLVNAFTFSAATEVAAILHHAKRAKILGEETGGSYIGNISGYIPTLRLPNSRIQINLALISIKRSFFGEQFTDRGVLPDILVEPAIDDILMKNDVTMTEALAL
ncbi:hypothetical protein J4E06_06375 [Muricauda sp. NFXS6]|uniref:S41 family peptidase n=1 Tax=Allomuricauda sp. NFXS6 TaxID=2819094 RepID=UPI0032DFA39F